MAGKWVATWSSLNEYSQSGFVFFGKVKSWWSGDIIDEYIEHHCSTPGPPPSGKGKWSCWCGREWRWTKGWFF